MKKNFNHISFLKSLLQFSPRQLEGEAKAAKFIVSVLKDNEVPHTVQYFTTKIPKTVKAVVKADGKKIPCQSCCFVSGKIEGKDSLVSSLIPSRLLIEKENINFNPESSAISPSNFYFAPSLAVSKDDIPTILKAKKVEGEVIVKPINHKSANILVGNKENPKSICFAHYDSLNMGAIDNGSGTTAMMGAFLKDRETLKDTLYIFSGNEEISYDKPTYWGHGFRAFESAYPRVLKNAKRIVVIDSLGNGPTQITKDPNLVYLAFPIKKMKDMAKKISVVFGDFEHLMSVYHSNADDISGLKQKHLEEASNTILKLVNK